MAKGAKKSAKVSVKEWEKATKDNFPASVTEQWFGIPITIRYTISLGEMLEFVDGVVASCFDDERGYIPEIWDFAFYNNILDYYTNITLPQDIGKKYELIYGSNIIEFVKEHISEQQWFDIENSICSKVRYIKESNIKGIEKEAVRLLDAFEELQKLAGNMFEGVGENDVRNLVQALSEHGTLDEEKIVKAILDNKSEAEEEPAK